MNGAGITIVSASAGSGKTHRLTQEVVASLAAEGDAHVDVTGLVAVTFTRKAHDELAARIRHTLVAGGAYEEAMRLPLAYVGTVHAAALRLLQEFALDAGLSPSVDVVVGDEKKLLRQALERALDPEVRERLDTLAARLELRIARGVVNWVTPVAEIMDLARSNRIPSEALAAMAERSVASLLALLPRAMGDGRILEAALGAELELAEAALSTDTTKVTIDAVSMIRKARGALSDGELCWSAWQRLAALKTSKRSAPLVHDLQLAAARYGEHPRLHEELRATTLAIFDAARAGLDAYRQWKRERRVVDYVDMLDGALDLVEHPRVRAELARRLQLVVVDELQDTSPIQLALFVRLHALAGRSLWVGDRKQCIFEYAGADPVLMDAVGGWVEREGGSRDRLAENRRSRPELVEACSALFAEAFASHGLAREEVVVRAHRVPEEGLAALPAFGLWTLASRKADSAEALAEGVRRLLDAPNEYPVLDRPTREVRPARAGDVAILVATNEHARLVAEALHARGVPAALARAGLLGTPEGTLADAALRWLLDESDAHAAAVVEAMTGWEGTTADAWLDDRLRRVAATERVTPLPRPWQRALEAVRPRLVHMAPTEALDATLAALDVTLLCARWPDPAQRVANLDALRAAAQTYEKSCAQEREAATLAGMLRCFDALRSLTLQDKEMLAADAQHVLGAGGAVVVSTYHKAKGLEWPIVVLAELDRKERRDAFEVSPEPSAGGFNPERPLEGRSIRYWPWPLGQTEKAPLRDAAEGSPEGRLVAAREARERVRLLYVGFTRARDHLVLGVPLKTNGTPQVDWLNALCDAAGEPLLGLPFAAADGATAETTVRTAEGTVRVATRVRRLVPERGKRPVIAREPMWFARAAAEVVERAAYRIRPSAAEEEWSELASEVAGARIGEVERLGTALAVTGGGYDDDVLGNAVHAFLAADVEGLAGERRVEIAERLIAAAGLSGAVRAEALVGAGDELRAWVGRRWPGARWYREMPIEGTVASAEGDRRVSGVIDLLLETGEGWVVIDHKTFPGKSEGAWRKKCAEFFGQLGAYQWLLETSGKGKAAECWVHFPVGGGLVQIAFPCRSMPIRTTC